MAMYLGFTAGRNPINENVMQAAIDSVIKLNDAKAESNAEEQTGS